MLRLLARLKRVRGLVPFALELRDPSHSLLAREVLDVERTRSSKTEPLVLGHAEHHLREGEHALAVSCVGFRLLVFLGFGEVLDDAGAEEALRWLGLNLQRLSWGGGI